MSNSAFLRIQSNQNKTSYVKNGGIDITVDIYTFESHLGSNKLIK